MGPIARTIGKTAISVVVLAYLASRLDLRTAVRFVWNAGPAHLLMAVLVLMAASLLPAIRWERVLRGLGEPLGYGPAIRLSLIGAFFNQVLPTSVGGDVVKAWYTAQRGIDGAKAAESVLQDRILGLVALALQMLVGLPYVWRLTTAPAAAWGLAMVLGTVIAGLLALIFLDRILPGWARCLLLAGRGRFPVLGRCIDHLLRLGAGTRASLLSFPESSRLLVLSLANQLMVAGVLHLLFRSCGVAIPLAATLILFPFVALVGMIPVSLAGWGVREGAMVTFFAMVRVPREASLGVSVLFGLTMLASTLVGGVLWLTGHHRARGAGAAS